MPSINQIKGIRKHMGSYERLPRNLAEMKECPEANLKNPEGVVFLTIAALCAYEFNPEDCYDMLNYLRGPRPLSNYEKQFIRDRFSEKAYYIPRSYFQGAIPENDYSPDIPYTVRLKESMYSPEGYKKYDVISGGADSPRDVVLRPKPSTSEWYLWDQHLLPGIRPPKSADPWA